MARIFISYRRSDTGGHANTLHDRLRHWYDTDALFYDKNHIDSGDHFPDTIQSALDESGVILILIGPDWLDELLRRAADPSVKLDYVRHEVATALTRRSAGQALVIPVLLGGAQPPQNLPADLAGLAELDACNFHDQGKTADWDSKFVELRRLIQTRPDAPRERYRALSGPPQPWHLPSQDLSRHFHDPNGLLSRLHQSLQTGHSTALTGARASAALHGMGGIGKTQLALAYSHQHRDTYAGVWWLRAETADGLQQDAHSACAAVGQIVQPGQDAAQVFKHWLGTQRHAPGWLLVYDNAEDPAQLRPYLPDPGPHATLITSRRGDWRGQADVLELATWTPEQGADFLQQRLNCTTEHATATALSADLGGLPLALEMAAAYIETHSLTLADYQLRWQRAHQRLLTDPRTQASTGYPHTVAAALTLAWDKLNPAAQQLLSLLGQAAPEPVAERWLRAGADLFPPELAQAVADELDWDDIVAELTRHALTKRSSIPSLDRAWLAGGAAPEGTPTEQALTLHRLMTQVVRGRAEADGAGAVHVVWSDLLNRACPEDAEHPLHWATLLTLLPHSVVLAGHFSSKVTDWCELNTRMLDRCGVMLLSGFGAYALAAQHLKTNLELRCSVLGEGHPATLTSMNNLAETLHSQGDLAGARGLQEQVLAIFLQVLGEEHPATLTLMNNLALTLRSQGNLAEARVWQEQGLAICYRVLGGEHPATLTSMNNLALTLRSQGNLAEARVLQEQDLKICYRVLGGEHPATLTSMNNLAETLRSQGDLTIARTLQEQVLAIQRLVLGEDHPGTLISIGNLAETLRSQGDLAVARTLQQQVLETHRRMFGEEHPETLTSMNNLAGTLDSQGDLGGARVLKEQVLAIHRRMFGGEHPRALTSMNNLAHTLWRLDERPAALNLMQQAEQGFTQTLGPNHPSTQIAGATLAQWRTALP